MIRYHDAQDSLSAEAAPMLMASSLTAAPRAAQHLAPAAIQNSGYGDFGMMPRHPLAYSAAPLSTLVLIVAVVVALLALMKGDTRRLSFALSPNNPGHLHFIKSGRHGYAIRRR